MRGRWALARGIVALALSVALGGCDFVDRVRDRLDRSNAPAAGGARSDAPDIAEVPTAEPGASRSQWRAATERTRTVTGNLTASLPEGRSGPLVLAFGNGLTYQLQQLGIQNGNDATGAPGQTFAEALSSDPRAGIYIYRVLNETVYSVAPEGGMCGKTSRVTFVAIAEYVTSAGDWSFKVAAFRGPEPPGAGGDPGFCATFGFGLA